MKQIKIGRNPECELKVNDETVSRVHAQLTINDDGTFIIEDLQSASGTKVNGENVKRKKVTLADKIELGAKGYILNLTKLVPPKTDFSKEFEALKIVYEKYSRDKIRINKEVIKKSSLTRVLPMALPGIITICIGTIVTEEYRPIMTISGGALGIILPLITVGISTNQTSKRDELMEDLNSKFHVDYVCPNCKNFLGYISWESLKNRGVCNISNCKAKWS